MNLAGEFGDEFVMASTMHKRNEFFGLFTTTEVAERPVNWKYKWLHIKKAPQMGGKM